MDVPHEFFELGRRRTAKMLEWQKDRLKLPDIIANAYIQGVEDGYTIATNRNEV